MQWRPCIWSPRRRCDRRVSGPPLSPSGIQLEGSLIFSGVEIPIWERRMRTGGHRG